MFAIVTFHSFAYGLDMKIMQTGAVTNVQRSVALPALLVIAITSLAVNSFVLISGWYGIRFRAKTVFHLLTQAVLVCSILMILNFARVIQIPESLQSCTRMSSYWFLVSYLGLYLVAPYINMAISSSSQRQLIHLVVILICLDLVIGYRWKWPELGLNYGYSVAHFVSMYCFGRVLRTFEFELRGVKTRYVVFLLLGAIVASYLCSVRQYFANQFAASWYVFNYSDPLVVIGSISLFLLALRIKFSTNISWLASAMLSVYLIHDNQYVRFVLIKPHLQSQAWDIWNVLPKGVALSSIIFLVTLVFAVPLNYMAARIVGLRVMSRLFSLIDKAFIQDELEGKKLGG